MRLRLRRLLRRRLARRKRSESRSRKRLPIRRHTRPSRSNLPLSGSKNMPNLRLRSMLPKKRLLNSLPRQRRLTRRSRSCWMLSESWPSSRR